MKFTLKQKLSLQKYCQTLRVLYVAKNFDRQVLFEHRVNNLSISLDIMGGEKGILKTTQPDKFRFLPEVSDQYFGSFSHGHSHWLI